MKDFPIRKLKRRALVKHALSRFLISSLLHNRKPDDIGVTFCSPADLIGIEVLVSGTFEEEFLMIAGDLLHAHFQVASIDPALAVVLDVGANIGTHALFLSRLAGKVLAFEPNPAVCLVCRANTLCSGQSTIQVFDIALSDRRGTATLHTPNRENFGWATLERILPDTHAVSVRVEIADDFILPLLEGGNRIALIKIDVEEHEAHVLKGMTRILSNEKPLVLFECMPWNLAPCMAILKESGYSEFCSIERGWDKGGRFSKLLALLTNRTEVFIRPLDVTQDPPFFTLVAFHEDFQINGKRTSMPIDLDPMIAGP